MSAYGTLSMERIAVGVKINKWIDKKTKLITGECSDGWTHKQTDRQTAGQTELRNYYIDVRSDTWHLESIITFANAQRPIFQ